MHQSIAHVRHQNNDQRNCSAGHHVHIDVEAPEMSDMGIFRDEYHPLPTRAHLKLAKLLSFTHGLSQVAWSQFSTLWLMSVGFSPSQTGVLKTVSMVGKAFAQPLWAAVADLLPMHRIHPKLQSLGLHAAVITSLAMTIASTEALRIYGPVMRFEMVAILRLVGAMGGAGTNLVDPLVAQLSLGRFASFTV